VAKKQEQLKIEVREERPLKWPDGQERTLIDKRVSRAAWKKNFTQQLHRVAELLDKLGVSEMLACYNPSPADRVDPGVAVYFSKPLKEDYSWQSVLGIDIPNPTERQINDAFKEKAKLYHPEGRTPDAKLYEQLDQHKKRAIAWVNGTQFHQHEYCIACDRCAEPRWNMFAVFKIAQAAATMDEYGNPGTLERTFKGFKVALPAAASTVEVKDGVA
jgi:hypothetical protein